VLLQPARLQPFAHDVARAGFAPSPSARSSASFGTPSPAKASRASVALMPCASIDFGSAAAKSAAS
jgi:hypothetical protein